MTNKNYESIAKLVGTCLDDFLYANRREFTEESFGKLAGGVSARTIRRWRYNGIPECKDVDLVLKLMGKTLMDILKDEDVH
jgi:hypothetical protein